MVNQRSFGRRVDQQPRLRQTKIETETAAKPAISKFPSSSTETAEPPLDEELLEWTRARKRRFRIPWRQVSLMASLCFGVASFVLPDSVNDRVQWLLYALAAASLYGWFAKRRDAGHR
jgi:hypothetical protein